MDRSSAFVSLVYRGQNGPEKDTDVSCAKKVSLFFQSRMFQPAVWQVKLSLKLLNHAEPVNGPQQPRRGALSLPGSLPTS